MEVSAFHHIEFWVSNALQASFWYCCNFGFERFAEKRSKSWNFNQIAIKNGKVILVFRCSCVPTTDEISQNLAIHGDFIKDVAYSVDDLETCLTLIKKNGGKIIKQSKLIKDEFGTVKKAKIAGPTGNLVHTLVQNVNYDGIFLPGFKPIKNFKLSGKLGILPINSLDHVVENYPENLSNEISDWYSKMLKLNRFWSIDDVQVHTKYSALKAQIVSNKNNSVQVTIVEPVSNYSEKRGQVQEFLDFHGGPGIQHIAFKVSDIVKTVDEMKERGVEFLDIPDSYYDQLESRLNSAKMKIEENLKDLRKLKLLMDFDENGYLLQIFTKPMQDRPSLFIEIIQRHNFNGFGAGNFKALFEAVEEEQKKRGTLFRK